jgi:hypothetical protein
MTNENTPKKEGGAASALASLFGKKARPQAILSVQDPSQASTPASSPQQFEKKSPVEVIGLGISYSEVGVAEKLGISSEDVTWLRKGLLEAGKDYTREAGFVRITAAGLSKLEALLAQEEFPSLIVLATNLPNPKLVLARRPGGSDILRVRVADSTAWCKGMIMQDCQEASQGVYTCEARPRFKGRV